MCSSLEKQHMKEYIIIIIIIITLQATMNIKNSAFKH